MPGGEPRRRPGMARYFAFVVRHRYVTLAGLLLITAFFVAQFSRARLATDITQMFVDNPDVIDRYRLGVREFGSDEIMVVAFDGADVFTPEGLRRLAAAADEIERLDDVARVVTPPTATRIEGRGDELIVEPYMDRLDGSLASAHRLRDELAAHPLYRDLLVSRDGRTAAIVIELTADEDRPGEFTLALTDAVDEILDAHGIAPGGRHRLGFPVSVAEIIRESQLNMRRVFPVAFVMVFLAGWLLFRALWPVLLTLGVALVAVVWVMGFAILLSPDVNILITIVPIVILVLSFADVIHLTNVYLTLITDGVEQEAAVIRTATEVGPACLFTSLTTLLGFGSFASVPATIMRQFAIVMAFGTAGALFIAITLVPVLFVLFPRPKPRRTGLSAAHGSPLDRLLLVCRHLGEHHPRAIVAAAVLLTLWGAYETAKLRVEVDFVHRFDDAHPIQVANDFIQARMANANTAEILIEAPGSEGVYEPEFLRAVREMQRRVLALPAVDSALTLTDLLAIIHREMNADETAVADLPDTRDLVAQYVLLFSLGAEDDLARFVNFDRTRIRMAVRLNENGMQETHDASEQILAIAERTLPPGASTQVTGLMVLFGGVLQVIIQWTYMGMITACLTISAVFLWAFRSFRVAFGGMLCNFLPMLLFFGTLHWFDSHFDTDYIVIACVTLGIAVDDTIHFLNRYRIELAHPGGDVAAAVSRTFDHTGKPIVQTTLIILFGFAAFNLTHYKTSQAFGLMLGCALTWALLTDLLLLPVMIRAGFIRMPGIETDEQAEAEAVA